MVILLTLPLNCPHGLWMSPKIPSTHTMKIMKSSNQSDAILQYFQPMEWPEASNTDQNQTFRYKLRKVREGHYGFYLFKVLYCFFLRVKLDYLDTFKEMHDIWNGHRVPLFFLLKSQHSWLDWRKNSQSFFWRHQHNKIMTK